MTSDQTITKVEQARPLERTIENPAIGEHVTFLKTAEETGGKHLLCQVEIAPHGAQKGAMHFHLTFTESWEVLEGELNLTIDGEHRVLEVGQRAVAQPGAHHKFWNAGDVPVVYKVEMRPARNFEQGLRVASGLSRDGKTYRNGLPKNIFHLALLFQLSESYAAGMPLIVQKVVFAALAKVGVWIGADKAFDKYL